MITAAPLVRRLICAIALALAIVHLHAQVDPKTALLERKGWEAIAAGDARAAAAAFREAAAADPRNPRLLLGVGTAAFLERRDGDARDALERALALDPALVRAWALLGQLRYRTGDLPGAIAAYETLAGRVRDDAQVTATLARWRREADLASRMQLSVAAHFTVSFEGQAEERMAAAALESLERAYWRIGAVLGTYPADPIAVVLYSDEQFRDITRSPTWAAASYDGTIRVPVRGALDNPAELDRVFAHEFAHALVRSLAPRGVPIWLNEGLAAALESPDGTWIAARVRREGRVLPLGALQAGFSRLAVKDVPLAYATSALAVSRLLDEAGGAAVANLLRDVGNDVDFAAAFARRMQRTLADLESAMRPD